MLGLLLLGALCLGAAEWQGRLTRQAHEQRETRAGIPLPGATHVPGEDGWALLVLGAESQALPLAELERSRGKTQASPAGGPEPRGRGPLSPTAPDSPAPLTTERPDEPIAPLRTHRVRAGETLGQICIDVYGTQRNGLPEAVARFNGLAEPGEIREGQELLLPDRARLEGPR